jgi:pimeloyl-ACP methyl ester carboxylesterase
MRHTIQMPTATTAATARISALMTQARRMRACALTIAMLTTAAAFPPPAATARVTDHIIALPAAPGNGANAFAASGPARSATRRVRARGLPAAASPAAILDACPPEAQGATCGHIDAPFDRADPSGGTIPIAFELYPHTDPGPAESAILVNFGGPGGGTTPLRGVPQFWFGPALAHHDLLLVDDRGRGSSAPIDCPDLQHGNGPLIEITALCAAQLAPHAADYSSAEIAADNDAVRTALGYQAVDFVGTSYGGIDAAAYATRFPAHLRSLVLDAPWGEPSLDPFARAADGTHRDVTNIGLLCRRSAACRPSADDAVNAVARLVRRVRQTPVTGTGLDANGASHRVTIDPTYLFVHIIDNAGNPDALAFYTPTEIPAAERALARGDAVPLLRLAAEGDFPIPGDSGDPREFSAGAFAATACVDQPWPWSPDVSLVRRQTQWANAVNAQPDAPFAPFSADEIMLSIYGGADSCLSWPHTGTRPPVEPGTRYPRVPTLVLQGELDTYVGLVPQTAALYPKAKLVTVKGAGHNTFRWSSCGGDLAAHFLNTLTVGSTSCAEKSQLNYGGIASFPRLAAESRAADPRAHNRASRSTLRVAHVAADVALDALKRSFLSSSGNGPGLRGGTFHTEYADVWTTTLNKVRWVDDVAVSGTLHWSFDAGALDADLQITGPGDNNGTLHLKGGWLTADAARSITVTGTLGGYQVAATVPST